MALCIDVETAGLDPHYDQEGELAIVLISYRSESITGIFDTYSEHMEPSVPITETAYSALGLSENELKGKHLDEN